MAGLGGVVDNGLDCSLKPGVDENALLCSRLPVAQRFCPVDVSA